MSGPVNVADVQPERGDSDESNNPTLEQFESRLTNVGGMPVRRALPKRQHRTVGAWCFLDHFGPASPTQATMEVGPHPHIGLQTVTWLLEGNVVHADSLGTEQLITPGQLNLMTAGRGVAHAEESLDTSTSLHGAQLWVALPDATRNDAPDFEHHSELPQLRLGSCVATVLMGHLGTERSPARTDTPLFGCALTSINDGAATVPLDPTFEHAIVVLRGKLELEGSVIEPGSLAYLGLGRSEVRINTSGALDALLVGGTPFEEDLLMWWNFVGRSRSEMERARVDWQTADNERFPGVATKLARIEAPRPTWQPSA